jgi:hypothetical protein
MEVSNGTKHNILLENQGLIKEWFFHWNKILVPTADIMLLRMTANKIQLLQHPPYLLDLAPEAYFNFWSVKEVLAGALLTLESFKKIWEGVSRNINLDQFATAVRRQLDCCNKCIWLNNGLTKKSSEINTLLTKTILFLFMFFNLILNSLRKSRRCTLQRGVKSFRCMMQRGVKSYRRMMQRGVKSKNSGRLPRPLKGKSCKKSYMGDLQYPSPMRIMY